MPPEIIALRPKERIIEVKPLVKSKPVKPKTAIPKPVKSNSAKFQALAYVKGQLEVKPSYMGIKTESASLTVNGIRDSQALAYLLRTTERWQGQECVWMLYPQLGGFDIVAIADNFLDGMQPGTFIVRGLLQAKKEGCDARMIRVNRNNRKSKDFSLILIDDTSKLLDEVADASFVEVRGTIQGFRMIAEAAKQVLG